VLDLRRTPVWWGLRRPREAPTPIGLLRDGVIDPRLAGLLWRLIEGRVPLIVAAGPQGTGKTAVLTALLDFLPPEVPVRLLAGQAEDYGWLPQATELGWRPGGADRRATHRTGMATSPGTVILAPELSAHLPTYIWGDAARVAIRALQLGYGLATTVHAESLTEVLESLEAVPVALSPDELRRLGLVLIVRRLAPDGPRRIVAAHYLRPLERDAHGHLQRRPPVVLATWDPASDTFEDYAWGVTSELAVRVGSEQAAFERDIASRASFLARLVEEAVTEPEPFARQLADWRASRDVPDASSVVPGSSGGREGPAG
jgi:hypothetical protein